MNTVNALAGGDILKWSEVMALPYIQVFAKLKMNKAEGNYNKKYAELVKNG